MRSIKLTHEDTEMIRRELGVSQKIAEQINNDRKYPINWIEAYFTLKRKFDLLLTLVYISIGISFVVAIWVTYLLTQAGFIEAIQ